MPLIRRMLETGLPSIVASGILLMVPLVGRMYLDAAAYSTWALLSTVVTISIVIDFGAPAYVMRMISSGFGSGRAIIQGVLLSSGGSFAIGVAVALVWPLYSAQSGFALSGRDGVLLCLFAGGSSALRAALIVLTSALLAYRRNGTRGLLILTQAALQFALTWMFLATGLGVMSLVLGAAISASILMVPAAITVVRCASNHAVDANSQPKTVGTTEFRRFASTKTLVTVIGLTLTQLDRWIVGGLADASLLETYDTVVRIASIPRVLAINLAFVLVAEGAKGSSRARDTYRLWIQSSRIVGVATLLASVGVVLVIYILDEFDSFGQEIIGSWGMLLAVLVWFGMNALTAPVSLITTGEGRPGQELYYLLPCAVLTLGAWTAGYVSGSAHILIYGAGAALAVTSAWFAFIRPPQLWKRAHA